MTWANPNAPNLPDFLLFVQSNMGIGAGYLPQPIPAPAAPGLTGGSGGSLPSGAVYVVVTYVSQYGETLASPEASVAVTGPTGSVSVASPPAAQGATGYRVYAAAVSGAEALQGAGTIGAPYALNSLVAGTTPPPATDTSGSPWPGYALTRALGLVLNIPGIAGLDYTLACYNCAGHLLFRITPDQPSKTFFADYRSKMDLLEFTAGLVASSSDQGTSETLAVSDAVQQLTIGDLQFTKTPYGIEYLSFNQDFGTIFGLT